MVEMILLNSGMNWVSRVEKHWNFYYQVTLCLSAVFAVVWCLSVCLSVRLSVCVLYPDGWRYRHTFFSARLHHRFSCPHAPVPDSKRNLFGGALNARGEILRLPTEIAVYLENDERQIRAWLL